ncbi:YIP1 family protein [bacterium]|nr:YIP1 family protein [bacterium]
MANNTTNPETQSTKEISPVGRIIGIFTSPRETFESIRQKPTWLVPFIISILFAIVFTFLAMDIVLKDQIAQQQARGVSQEQIEAQSNYQTIGKYVSGVFIIIGTLVSWVVVSAVFLFGGNTVMGGEAKFKKIFSVVAWTSLIGILGGLIKIPLILSKGTMQGVTTSLAILLPLPEPGENPSFLYQLFTRFDLFTIWTIALYCIGLAVVYQFTTKKAATLVISLWAIYIILSVTFGSLFGGFMGM